MKHFWTSLTLLLLLLALSLFSGYRCRSFAGELTGQLIQAQQFARNDQWDKARDLTHLSYDQWQGNHFYLHVVMRHSDTDEILRTFRAVLEYLNLQEMDQYMAANADLIAQIQLLAEMEQPSLVNVL